jgi:hypothetical protein
LKLYNFQQVLPRLDARRGLINFGGTILKTLFRTATNADVLSLHKTLDDLQEKGTDVTHSLSSQLTYIKKLGSLTEASADAIPNLTLIVTKAVVCNRYLKILSGLILLFNIRVSYLWQ